MLLLPHQLRDNLRTYILNNPSPAVSVGQAMQMLNELQQLKTFGQPEVVVEAVEPDDGPMEPGKDTADG